MLWTEKYRPTNIEELLGNSRAVETATKWINNISKKSIKPLIISGPSGVGKTSLSEILLKTQKNKDRSSTTFNHLYRI